jgi:hypothetical protein
LEAAEQDMLSESTKERVKKYFEPFPKAVQKFNPKLFRVKG